MNSKGASAQRLFGADLIRATAIVFVILSHTFPGLTTFTLVREIRGTLGFLGVEIFFVLSGFLIGGILLKQMFAGALDSASDLTVFWKRRWFRTLPTYYLFLTLFIAVAYWIEPNSVIDARKYFWFGQALWSAHPKFFTVAWSLAVEEVFYFSLPLLLWVLMKMFGKRTLAFWVTVTFFLVFPPVLRGIFVFGDLDDGLRKVTLFRLDAIMFGVILAFLKMQVAKGWAALRYAWPIGVLGLAALIFFSTAAHGKNPSVFFDRVLQLSLVSLNLALIFPQVVEIAPPRKVFAGLILKISLWSYSMYLGHAWLAFCAVAIFSRAGWPTHGINAVILSCLNWVMTLALSAVLYPFFEKPLMDLRDRPLRSLFKLKAAFPPPPPTHPSSSANLETSGGKP